MCGNPHAGKLLYQGWLNVNSRKQDLDQPTLHPRVRYSVGFCSGRVSIAYVMYCIYIRGVGDCREAMPARKLRVGRACWHAIGTLAAVNAWQAWLRKVEAHPQDRAFL